MRTEAYLSPDRRYRYWLLRVWDEALPVMCVIGVNPSTADETADDPTIRKCIGFASRLGFGGLLMLNLAAYRSTDPVACKNAYSPIGFFNTSSIMRSTMMHFGATKIIAAWGKNGNHFPGQVRDIAEEFPQLECWGRNGDGTPRHPLTLAYTTQLEPLRANSLPSEADKPSTERNNAG